MPYRSDKQRKFIHAKAGEGVPWAKKFVRDSHQASKGEAMKTALKRHRKKRRRHR